LNTIKAFISERDVLMNISRREKKLLIFVLGAAVIAGFYMLFYQPLMTRIEQVFAVVESEQAEIQNLLLKEQENAVMLDEITQLETDIDTAIGALPGTGDEPGLVEHLHHIFAPYDGKNTLRIEDPILHPVVDPEFSEVGVNLSFEVTYEAFNSLLKALEESHYKNRVESFSANMVQLENGDETQMVAVDMTLTFYFSDWRVTIYGGMFPSITFE